MRPLLDELEEPGAWAFRGDELPVRVDFVVGQQLLELHPLLHQQEPGVQLLVVWQFFVEGSNVSNTDAS